jgi:hypothetical protein
MSLISFLILLVIGGAGAWDSSGVIPLRLSRRLWLALSALFVGLGSPALGAQTLLYQFRRTSIAMVGNRIGMFCAVLADQPQAQSSNAASDPETRQVRRYAMNVENKIEEYDVVKSSPQGDFEHREKVVECRSPGGKRPALGAHWCVFSFSKAIGLNLPELIAEPSDLLPKWCTTSPTCSWAFVGLTNSPSIGGWSVFGLIAMIVYALFAGPGQCD